jgi:hypothetical protein
MCLTGRTIPTDADFRKRESCLGPRPQKVISISSPPNRYYSISSEDGGTRTGALGFRNGEFGCSRPPLSLPKFVVSAGIVGFPLKLKSLREDALKQLIVIVTERTRNLRSNVRKSQLKFVTLAPNWFLRLLMEEEARWQRQAQQSLARHNESRITP